MDNGYRAITEEEGAICQTGDQYKFRNEDWEIVKSRHHGARYDAEDFDESIYRRPIAHYATPTEKVVEHLVDDATISKTETVAWDGEGYPPAGTICKAKEHSGSINYKTAIATGITYGDSAGFAGIRGDLADGSLFWSDDFHPIPTQSQIEEREREEANSKIEQWRQPNN